MNDARLLRLSFFILLFLAFLSLLTLFLHSHTSSSSSSILASTSSFTAQEISSLAFSTSDTIKDVATHFSILLPPPLLHIATIVELRPLGNLVPLILHFSSVLGPTWPIHVFHTSANAYLFRSSPAIRRLMAEGLVTTYFIPQEETFTSHDAVSEFLAGSWFWEKLAPAENVLLFQADSILCSRSEVKMEDFLEWDFIGAPISPGLGKGFNGGLSLRKRATMMEIVGRWNWTDTRGFEDQWFYTKIEELIAEEEKKETWRHGEVDEKAPKGPKRIKKYKLPDDEEAGRFAVETIWRREPFGLHQVGRWQKEHLEELDEWCPEYVLAGKGTLY